MVTIVRPQSQDPGFDCSGKPEKEAPRQGEVGFERSARKIREVLESITYSYFAVDRHWRFLDLNHSAELVFGKRREELLGQVLGEVLPDTIWGEFSRHYQRAMAEQEAVHFEATTLNTPRWWEVHAYPSARELRVYLREFTRHNQEETAPPPHPELERGVAERTAELAQANEYYLQQEIAERKQAEQRLLAEKRFSDTVIDHLPGTFCLFDESGKMLRWNRSLEQATGYSAEEIAGMKPADFFSGDEKERIEQKIRVAFAQGTAEVEAELTTRDGKKIPYLFTGNRVNLEDRPCLIGMGIDLTERRRLEDQFRQAQKMEAIGQLAGGVAHDFNNLLTIITGYSEIVLSRLQAENALRPLIQEIRAAGERAAGLTRQLLAFSRKQILSPVILDLNALVKDMDKMLRRMIGEDIALAIELSPDLERVKADPGQLEQVIMNLVVNARDAMPGGGSLTIRTGNAGPGHPCTKKCREEGTSGPCVVLEVQDTGCGMDEATRARIFEPFFTTKAEGKGTGLGLATVYGIVKQSGGHIEVESAPGQGTTFRIFLPPVQEATPAGKSESGLFPLRKGTETVLLVEDQDEVRSLGCLGLRATGYTVLEARDGVEALEVAGRHPGRIHLLVTDVIMPRMGGPELAQQLSSSRPGLKTLFLSGYTTHPMLPKGLTADNTNFLQKPFTATVLARKVQALLDAESEAATKEDRNHVETSR